MQKMNLKRSFISTALVIFATGFIFVGSSGEVRADDATTDDTEIIFEVTLQTPFAKIPSDAGDCTNTEKNEKPKTSYYPVNGGTDDENGNRWVCYPESSEWQQVIRGEDGGKILESYAALIYKWLAGFIGLAAVLMIIAGGIQISTAGANQEGLQSGKDRILAAFVGLALLFLSGLILYTINPNFFTFT